MVLPVMIAFVSSVFFVSCNSCSNRSAAARLHVSGTLDAPLEPEQAPAWLAGAMDGPGRFHEYEIMADTAHAISVEAVAEIDTASTGGYGVVVVKGSTTTFFPDLRHSRQPKACYDAESDVLLFACSAMEGTGVQVERLYVIRFDEGGKAHIAGSADPYDIQQEICQRLGYSIEGEQITFFDGEREIARATNTVTDMGGFDSENPLWVGEQISYDLDGEVPLLLVTPGVNFTTGLVLTYDDMPSLKSPLSIDSSGKVTLGDFSPAE